ncbi:FUSC family protein [Burkholderia gladioli]|uniref:FUSC family protein n=1 Tax=Burkholderia gladioli TaxID=28095 RepID=UPI001640A20D|nr:FUSC family protein [Burkholderia gladioli]MDN7922605.1 FUSC family protein [Burkholderia gladioli]
MLRHLHHRVRHLVVARLRSLNVLAGAWSRRRPLWMVSFAVNDASLSEGLRAACASTAMLVIGNLLHEPDFAWAAIGAFWTCLADAAGSNRTRFASMASFAVLSTICGGVTAFASGVGTLAALAAVLVFTSLGALGRIWGAATAQVSILAATACVVMADRPMHDWRAGLAFLGVYFGGCVFAIVLSLTVWRIHPFAQSRGAVRGIYVRLADIALDASRLLADPAPGQRAWELHASKYRSDARAALEAARRTLARMPVARTDRRESYANLLIALAEGERWFAHLIAVAGVCQRGRQTLRDPARAARVLAGIAELLHRTGDAIDAAPWERPDMLQRRLRRFARGLDAALGESMTMALQLEPDPADVAPTPRRQLTWTRSLRGVLARSWASLRANLSWQSIGLRHAARVGVATTLGFLVVRLLGVPFGYWTTMATLLILQPSIAGTWPRSVERAAGSIIGGLLAAAIGLAVHSPIGISLVVFPLVCATMALRPVSYSLFVLFLTPTFVLVADFATPAANELGYALTRLGNNVLGCAIALAATFLLWPTREQIDIRGQLAAAIAANLRYLVDAIEAPGRANREAERLRREAGLASNNAEEAFNRIRLERLDDSRFDTAASTVLGLLRRMAGTAAHLRASVHGPRMEIDLVEWVATASEDIDAMLASGRVPPRRALPPREKLAQLETDVVGQIALLQRLIGDLQHDDGPLARRGVMSARRAG